MGTIGKPGANEANTYFTGYISSAPGNDLGSALRASLDRTRKVMADTPPEMEAYRYAPGKWSIKDVLQHLTDTERIFTYRALCIARGEQGALPGFDEDSYADHADTEHRSLQEVLVEHERVRAATIALFDGLTEQALARTGIANGDPISVRALGWTLVGHAEHHLNIIEQRYR
ncbi:MAG: DinB family protein [Flavobacteriales bacterium]